jgi:hypothetical protein
MAHYYGYASVIVAMRRLFVPNPFVLALLVLVVASHLRLSSRIRMVESRKALFVAHTAHLITRVSMHILTILKYSLC